MNLKIIDKNTMIVKINNAYKKLDDENQTKIIKEILILIRKRYAINIYGFYEVDIYKVSSLLHLLIFKKIEQDSLYSNSIDLRIKKHSKELNIKLDSNYLIDNLNKKYDNVYKICEHYSIEKLNLHY